MSPAPPSIRLEGDQDRALALVPNAKALLYRLLALKANMGVGTFSLTEVVATDATIVALSTPSLNILTITVAPVVIGRPVPGFTPLVLDFPNFLSGVSNDGYLVPDPRASSSAVGQELGKTLQSFAPMSTERDEIRFLTMRIAQQRTHFGLTT